MCGPGPPLLLLTMSKMPAKKRSCFQITSVTTAQAASSITEDTESLDDPDESRTEDVSSEIFDVSRATDYGPEEVVERSSSEETLNNVGGEADTPGTMSPNVPHEAPLIRSGPPPPQASPAPQACSSRFRVIKLDHSSGEPYRRGRWTCTEYYDKDSDGSTLISRHTGGSYEHSAPDRDSGLGGSVAVVSSVHHDSGVDTSLTAVSQPDKMNQPWQQQPIQGSAQPMHPATVSSQPMMVPPQGHTYLPNLGLGAPQNVSLAQPGAQQTNMSASQAQQFPYSQPGLVMTPQASGQAEYGQHRTVLQSQGTTQNAANSLIAGTGAPSSLPGQHLPAPLLGIHSKPTDSTSQASGLGTHPVHMQQAGGGVVQASMSSIGVVPQKSISQQASGSSILGSHHAMTPGVQNVPVPSTGVSGLSSSVPSVSAIPVTMPIAPATFVQSSLSSHTSVSRSNSLIPTVGLPPLQGTANVNISLPQSNSQFQTQPLAGQIDDRRKSEPLPQPSMPLISEKSFGKVPITDTLTNPLHLPVFGLPIPVDGEDDSSSSANVVAIDNKIEQAMDLVKSHLMYAVREEVEVLKEQIKELIEKNSTLERENALLKSLSNSDQLSQLSPQAGLSQQQPPVTTAPLTAPQTAHPPQQPNVSSA